jgi:hypothetical protein
MTKQGIVLDQKAQEQPEDKDRAQTAQKAEPGHMPSQPVTRKGEEAPHKEKSAPSNGS